MKLERELMRGAGPVAVLSLLERREMYGYEMIEALSNGTGGVLAMGQSTLYTILYNLERKGLLRSVWRDDGAARERKYYRLTRKGLRHLRTQQEQWTELVTAMKGLGVVGASEA